MTNWVETIRRAQASIIATVILIAITVALGVAILSYILSYTGTSSYRATIEKAVAQVAGDTLFYLESYNSSSYIVVSSGGKTVKVPAYCWYLGLRTITGLPRAYELIIATPDLRVVLDSTSSYVVVRWLPPEGSSWVNPPAVSVPASKLYLKSLVGAYVELSAINPGVSYYAPWTINYTGTGVPGLIETCISSSFVNNLNTTLQAILVYGVAGGTWYYEVARVPLQRS